ncbi:MAG: heavy metal translocating P-type ATPase [Halothiobacillaceae bacterium]
MEKQTCFHCGLDVPQGVDLHYPVLGKDRVFCCSGCYAACKTIVEAGFEDFYRYREQQGEVNAQVLPDVLKNLTLYDRPEIQQGFVRTEGAACEAALILENIRCAACLWLNEQHLRAQPGVLDVHLDYASHQARIKWDPAITKLSDILQAIAAIGYVAHPYDPAHRERLLEEERRRSVERLLFAGLLGMQVMMFAIATYWMGGYDETGKLALWEIIGRWTSLLITLIMLVYSGADFFTGAWRDLRHKRLGMDVPIVLGLVTAWTGSLWATIVGDEDVYFDSIGMFIFFVLLARVVELKGRMAAADVLDRLMKVIPRTAFRVEHGQAVEVPVVDLMPGDIVRLLPGESVPVDGRLISGASSFDESHLTGESVPVLRKEGDWIAAGSCNVDQTVMMKVERVSGDSTMNELQRLMDRGLSDKPRLAELAERISVPFVAGVLLLSALTAVGWWLYQPAQVLPNTIAVLIITCPCALALATPVALAIAAGRFAEIGILPLRMSAIEGLATADTLVLDKTGTLTQGRPRLTEVRMLHGMDEHIARALAASMERHSEHPIAYALREGVQPFDQMLQVRNVPGQGLEAEYNGATWRLGALEYALGEGGLAKEDQAWLDTHIRDGGIVVLLSRNGEGRAIFVMHDAPRAGAVEFIQAARRLGLRRVVILSGDQPGAVRHLAKRLGIEEHYGGLRPEDKLAWIQRVQAEGARVLMVGDGINDAPTLAAAQVSASFGAATTLAQLHSDLVLLGTDLTGLARGILLARMTRRNTRQNLAWAAGYNVVAVPFAALGFVTPWMAAIGMSLSSLLVVGNALRLKRMELPEIRGFR